ncbi:MAG TPA: hypothetical protein VIK91_18470 [Nannocystis sp.]
MNNDDLVTTVGPHPSPVTAGVRWGAVFAGTLVAAGAWILLHLLGMAVGLSAIEPQEPGSLRAVGIGTGVWSLVAPALALFLGGLATGWLVSPATRASRAIHGTVVWSLSTVVSITLLWTTLGAIVGGVVSAGSQVASATVGGAMEVIQGGEITPESLGLSGQDLLAPVNERLRAEGKPEVSPDQVTTALREALRTAVREGRVDRQILIDAFARHTALSPRDAADIAATVEQRYDERMGKLVASAREQALTAADVIGKSLLGLCLAMLLALVGAVAGVMIGGRGESTRSRVGGERR